MDRQGIKRSIDSHEAERVIISKVRDSVSNENTHPLPDCAAGSDKFPEGYIP